MGIDIAHYHGWHGRLHSPWLACLALVRVGLLQVFRRKLYWLVLFIGLAQFLLYWSIIYGVTQINLPERTQANLLAEFGFSAEPAAAQETGYINFIEQQGVVVMILLAFSGGLLVGSDFRQRSLPFYLSRRIDRRHYIVGKLLTISALICLLTVLPALLLFIEFGMFTSSADYWIDNISVVGAVLAYGAVLCVVLSILLTTISAYLQRLAPIAITWSSLFVLLSRLGDYLHESTGDARWRLIDLWSNMHDTGRLFFGAFESAEYEQRAQWAAAVLAATCLVCLVLLARRVRAVEIVQ